MNFFPPAILTLAAMTGLASATVVNFDFNNRDVGDPDPAPFNYVGLAAAPDSAGATAIWNSIRRSSSTGGFSSANSINNTTPEVNSTGGSTSVSVSVNSVSGGGLLNATMGNGRSLGDQELAGGAYNNLMGDYLQLSTNVGSLVGTAVGTIAGLVPNASYAFYFYGQGSINSAGSPAGAVNGNAGQNSLFAITDTLNGTAILAPEQTGWGPSNNSLTEGVEYVEFTTTANSSGQVFFRWQNVVTGVGGNVATDNVANGVNAGSPFATFNGLQIVAVPEPSTVFLGGLGILGLLARRRRP